MSSHAPAAAPSTVDTPTAQRPVIYAVFLVVCFGFGIWAAFQLTLDKFTVLEHPTAQLSCNISPFIQCSKNLGSAQGAVFGFPNPLIGLMAWIAPLVVGAALLAGARFDRWFWALFNLGTLGGWVFVCWLQFQSIEVLHTLCIWCMLTWSVTIPLFWITTFRNLATGVYGAGRTARVGAVLLRWAPLVVIANYLVIAVAAQLQFDLIHYFFD